MTGSLHCWLALWILFWLHDDMIYSDKKQERSVLLELISNTAVEQVDNKT